MGQLYAEDRDATRALHQDGLAGNDLAVFDQGVPRRYCSARQRRTLFDGQGRWNLYDALLLQHHVFRQHAVDAAAEGASPPDQRWKKQPATLSPTFTRVTPAPTSVTSPAPSESGTILSRTGIR